MRIGRLRHRLQLQSSTKTQDAYGEQDLTWATYVTVWGAIEPLRGTEQLVGQQIESQTTHRIIIRKQPNFTVLPRHRIIHEGRTFEITSVNNIDERDRELRLLAEEVI